MCKPLTLYFCLVVAASAASNDIQISSVGNGIVTWDDTYSNGYYHIEWANPYGPWTNTWNELRNIPATGGLMRASIPMFFRVVYAPPLPMFEDFETQGGWTDHPAGAWTQEADTGTWMAGVLGGPPGFVFARTDPANARSGLRCIGVETNIPGFLVLPPITNPDRISFWVKGAGSGPPSGYVGTVTIEATTDAGSFPMTWFTVAAPTSVHVPLGYFEVSIEPLWRTNGQDPPVAGVRIRMEASSTGSIYLDDVTVLPAGN